MYDIPNAYCATLRAAVKAQVSNMGVNSQAIRYRSPNVIRTKLIMETKSFPTRNRKSIEFCKGELWCHLGKRFGNRLQTNWERREPRSGGVTEAWISLSVFYTTINQDKPRIFVGTSQQKDKSPPMPCRAAVRF